MSLAWRILLVVLLLNLAVVGAVQFAAHYAQQRWVARQQEAFLDAQLVTFLRRVYTAERFVGDERQARNLVEAGLIRELFQDVVVTSGRPPFEGFVYLNPRGAVHRDPDRFPRAEILAGMEAARATDGLVPAAGGYCKAIRRDAEVVGALWFQPYGPPPDTTAPVGAALLTILASTLLFGLLAHWIVVRSVVRPLRQVEVAAAALGSGRFGERVSEQLGIRELEVLARAFNAMAARVEGNTEELREAVARAVEQTRRQEQALVVSSRLAAIGTLAAGIAHEINNPIGGMINAVHRLQQSQGLDERQRAYLKLVQEGLERVARTSRKVLDFSPKQVDARPFRMADAVDAARALVDHRIAAQGVAFACSHATGLPLVHGDAHEIQQVFLNLYLNSLDALQSRGRGGTIRTRTWFDGAMVHAEVVDDGPGMAKEDLGRVTDPFFSRKDRPDASGLGMFMSYSIVRNHGGEMRLDSEPGKGFRVEVLLPPAPGAPGAAGH